MRGEGFNHPHSQFFRSISPSDILAESRNSKSRDANFTRIRLLKRLCILIHPPTHLRNAWGNIHWTTGYRVLNSFSSSSVIHQVHTKKITTVKDVWLPGLISNIFLISLLLSFCFDWGDISNTRDSVSSAIQTPRMSSKMLRCAAYFQLSSRYLDMSRWNTVSRVWCITWELLRHEDKACMGD